MWQKTSYQSEKRPNKALGITIDALNVIVTLIAWTLGRIYPLPVSILTIIYFSVMLGITVNKRNAEKIKKDNDDKVKRLTREIWEYVLWMIFIVVVIGLQIWRLGGFQPATASSSVTQTPEALATTAVQQFKSSNTLPYTVDSVTTLTDVTSDDNTLQYHERIKGADTSKLSNSYLYNYVRSNDCANTDTRKLLNDGVNMQYLYTIYETGQQYTATVTDNDCSK